MRRYLDIIESLDEADLTLIDLAERWDNYNAGDIWTFGRAKLEDEIIAYARTLGQEPLSGELYRGQGILDEDFDRLSNGETITVEMVKTKLSSWSKNPDLAADFAKTSNECHGFSSVAFRYPVAKLTPIIDFTQCPPVQGFLGQREDEVLCLHCELMISPEMVYKSYRYTE